MAPLSTCFDQLPAYVPKQPAAYLRISSDRSGLEAGVDRQNDAAEDTGIT